VITIGIDTGGTFTDAYIVGGDGSASTLKVDTTPHDLTVCFGNAIDASADALGLSRNELLERTHVIRFSSTIGTNTVLTRGGPRLGLIVTEGHESDLYGAAEGDTIFDFIPRDLVAGISEGVSESGEIERAPDPAQVNAVVRGLLERGARILVVSLRNASANRANEVAVRGMVDGNYPRHYLGAIPVLLSTQIGAGDDDGSRTAATVVNAYMHKKLATSLYKAEDDVRRDGFRNPVLVVNADGGVTRVAKTKALTTYQSGPTAGIHGSSMLCRAYGIEAALTADVGGTSTDVGVIIGGRPIKRERIDVAGMLVAQPSVELVSFAVGGGSLAATGATGATVGPESAGSLPGPACFGLGGRNATPTDAWLVLGYLDPAYYLGGRKRLDVAAAREAIQEHVAGPLGISVEEGALAIKRAAEEQVADGIEALLERADIREQLDGTSLADTAMIAYGGGGGVLIPAVSQRLGLGQVVLSRFSPVFSAFGVSTLDVRHTYEARVAFDAGAALADVVSDLVDTARRDMKGEGLDPESMTLSVSVSGGDGERLGETDDLTTTLGGVAAGVAAGASVVVELSAVCPVQKAELPDEPSAGGHDAEQARTKERDVVLETGPRTVGVYAREQLQTGDVLSGPALIESGETTYLVPEGMRCTVDRFGSAVLTQEA
jgi:N-methylhydantoinase A/acetophenone carboxylase